MPPTSLISWPCGTHAMIATRSCAHGHETGASSCSRSTPTRRDVAHRRLSGRSFHSKIGPAQLRCNTLCSVHEQSAGAVPEEASSASCPHRRAVTTYVCTGGVSEMSDRTTESTSAQRPQSPPPRPGWQSTPRHRPAADGRGQRSGMPSWTNNLTARGPMPGPGGVALADAPDRVIASSSTSSSWHRRLHRRRLTTSILGDNLLGIFGLNYHTPSLVSSLVDGRRHARRQRRLLRRHVDAHAGATVGMRVMKLTVRDCDIGRPDRPAAGDQPLAVARRALGARVHLRLGHRLLSPWSSSSTTSTCSSPSPRARCARASTTRTRRRSSPRANRVGYTVRNHETPPARAGFFHVLPAIAGCPRDIHTLRGFVDGQR